MKQRIVRLLRNVAISASVMLIMAVVIGVGYVWYSGQQTPALSQTETAPVKAPLVPPTHVKPAANAPESIAIQSLTSPVLAGTNASLAIKTNPGSQCISKVTYGSETSHDSGLGPKTADDYGVVTWVWTVEATVPKGTWPIGVTCSSGKKSAAAQASLQVVAAPTQ